MIAFYPRFSSLSRFTKHDTPHKTELKPRLVDRYASLISRSNHYKAQVRCRKLGVSLDKYERSTGSDMTFGNNRRASYRSIESNPFASRPEYPRRGLKYGNEQVLTSKQPFEWKNSITFVSKPPKRAIGIDTLSEFLKNMKSHPKAADRIVIPKETYLLHRRSSLKSTTRSSNSIKQRLAAVHSRFIGHPPTSKCLKYF